MLFFLCLWLFFAGEAGLLGACFCFSSTLLAASATYAAPPARTMYNDALAREKTVRTALSNPDAPASVLAAHCELEDGLRATNDWLTGRKE